MTEFSHLFPYVFLALLDFVSRATVMAQASVICPFVNSGFSETAAWIQTKFCGQLHIHYISRPCFSFRKIFNFHIFSSAWLRQQSSWYGVFVIHHLASMSQSSRSYWADSFQISVVASPRPYRQTFFEFFPFCVNHVNMGPYGSQNFKRLLLPQITFESFQTFSEFSWPDKSTVLEFWNFDILIFQDFFFVLFNMWPYGSQKFQNATPPSNHFWMFSNFFWIFCSVVLTKVPFCIFEILRFWFFTTFFRVNMGPYGSQNFKTLLLPQITFEFFQSFPDFFLSSPDKSTVLNFWNLRFLTISFSQI